VVGLVVLRETLRWDAWCGIAAIVAANALSQLVTRRSAPG